MWRWQLPREWAQNRFLSYRWRQQEFVLGGYRPMALRVLMHCLLVVPELLH